MKRAEYQGLQKYSSLILDWNHYISGVGQFFVGYAEERYSTSLKEHASSCFRVLVLPNAS